MLKLENELKSIGKLEPGEETVLQMTGFSSSGIETEVGCMDGQLSGGSRSQSGPFHQSEYWSRVLGIIPCEAQSAGFLVEPTCLQLLAGVVRDRRDSICDKSLQPAWSSIQPA